MAEKVKCLEELESLLQSLERITGLRVTFQDPYGFFSDEAGNSYIHPDRIYHDLPFCQNANRRKCIEHDWKKSRTVAAVKERPFIWPCWLGPLQILIPLRWKGRHVGSIFLGPFISTGNKGSKRGNVSGEKDLPSYRLHNFGKDLFLFEAVATGIIEKSVAERIHGKGERWEKVYRLVINRFTEKIGVCDAARELNLSASRSSHLIKELFTLGLAADLAPLAKLLGGECFFFRHGA